MKTTLVWVSFFILVLLSACSSSDGGGGSSGDAGDTTIDGFSPGSDSSSGNDQSTGVDQTTGVDQSTTPGSCDGATPCGGDPVGNYTFGDACMDVESLLDQFDCEGASSSGGMTATGTANINSGNTYAINMTNTFDITLTIPLSCLPNEAMCEMGGGTVSGSNCVMSENGTDSDDDTGTWSTAGNTITFVSDIDDETETFEYCKQGSSLILFQTGGSDEPNMTIVLDS